MDGMETGRSQSPIIYYPNSWDNQDKRCMSTFALVAEQPSTMLLRQPASHSHSRIKLITVQPRSTTALGEAERRSSAVLSFLPPISKVQM